MEKPVDLIGAVMLGNYADMKRLIEVDKIDVNTRDSSGDTALHIAAHKGRREMVQFLLAHGAQVNATNAAGSTPLHKAAVANQIFLVEFLVKAGADRNIKNSAGFLPEQLTSYKRIQEFLEGGEVLQEEVKVPRELHGRIIGPKGATIRSLREQTGAQISVPDKDAPMANIVVRGRAPAIALAKAAILQITAQAPSIVIEEEGVISGPRVASGPKPAAAPAAGPTPVAAAAAQKPAAASAKPAAGGKASAPVADEITVNCPIPKEKHKKILGAGGSTLKKIIEETKVQVTLPSATNPDNVIKVKGQQAGVDKAVEWLYKITRDKPEKEKGKGRGGGHSEEKKEKSTIDVLREGLLQTNSEAGYGGKRGDGRRPPRTTKEEDIAMALFTSKKPEREQRPPRGEGRGPGPARRPGKEEGAANAANSAAPAVASSAHTPSPPTTGTDEQGATAAAAVPAAAAASPDDATAAAGGVKAAEMTEEPPVPVNEHKKEQAKGKKEKTAPQESPVAAPAEEAGETAAPAPAPVLANGVHPPADAKSKKPAQHREEAAAVQSPATKKTLPVAEEGEEDVPPGVREMEDLVRRLGFPKFAAKFRAELIDVEAAALLSDAQLEQLGLPMGVRVKLADALGKMGKAKPEPAAKEKPAPPIPGSIVAKSPAPKKQGKKEGAGAASPAPSKEEEAPKAVATEEKKEPAPADAAPKQKKKDQGKAQPAETAESTPSTSAPAPSPALVHKPAPAKAAEPAKDEWVTVKKKERAPEAKKEQPPAAVAPVSPAASPAPPPPPQETAPAATTLSITEEIEPIATEKEQAPAAAKANHHRQAPKPAVADWTTVETKRSKGGKAQAKAAAAKK